MKALEISKEKAIELYPEASPAIKTIFEETFGRNVFKKNIFERVNSFKDACIECGTTEEEFNAECRRINLPIDEIFYRKEKILFKAINEGWVPDYNNRKQEKWYGYFDWNGSAFVFSGAFSYYYYAGTGARLCAETKEKLLHLSKICPEIFDGFRKPYPK